VILAGGLGSRIGGDKVVVALRGRALLRYPLEAMRAALDEVAVISKAGTLLPQIDGAMVWIEPDEPQTPLFGIVEALGIAGGRPVLVCPGDYPFVTSDLLIQLATTPPKRHRAVVAVAQGVPRPLLGCYQPSAAQALREAAMHDLSPQDALAQLDPLLVEVADELELFDVDTPDDLLQAAAMLDQPSVLYPKVKS
jgi:molybdopterin-guanine dinucleotide biosynthesis protein A